MGEEERKQEEERKDKEDNEGVNDQNMFCAYTNMPNEIHHSI